MLTHGPSVLQGPVTRDNPWWQAAPRGDAAPVRHALIDRVRREIAAGTYDTSDKFQAALDQMVARLDRP